MFVVLLTIGYEYHDDYVELGTFSVSIPRQDDVWTYAHAEDQATTLAEMLVDYEDNGWWRINQITAIA